MRRKKRNKGKVTLLKEYLWELCKVIVKNRDNWTCYTCGAEVEGKNAHTGHFVQSSLCNLDMRYDIEWLRCQCYSCNIHKSGNYVTFRERLVKEKGLRAVVAWEQKRHETTVDYDYVKIILLYESICKKMWIEIPKKTKELQKIYEEAIKKYERMD